MYWALFPLCMMSMMELVMDGSIRKLEVSSSSFWFVLILDFKLVLLFLFDDSLDVSIDGDNGGICSFASKAEICDDDDDNDEEDDCLLSESL